MSEFHKLPSFGELEHSNVWGFGDAFEILCNDATILAKSFDEGTTEFNDVFKSLMDVWAAIEDSIRRGKIRIESGKLIDLSEGLMQVSNPNVVVINKNDFLSFYRKNKNKLAQYLSYADLKIYQEEFLDRLASVRETSKGGRPPFSHKANVKLAVEKLVKRKPNITQKKIPYMPEVINAFAPNKGDEADFDMSAKEYKELFGCSISTVKKIVREVYKSNP
jgi:hypothetical protein